MEFILSVFKFFTFSSGFVSTSSPDGAWKRERVRQYERMYGYLEVGHPLRLALSLEALAFRQTEDASQCPLFDKHVDWTNDQWETYRRLNPAPPRSLR